MMVHRFDMAGYGLARWITFIVMAVALLYPIGRILMRIGLLLFQAILVLMPFFNLVGLWMLAFAEWLWQGSGRPGQSDAMKSFSCPDGTMVCKAISSLVSAYLVAFTAARMVGGAWAEEPDGRMLVGRVDTLLWGKTLQDGLQVTIITPYRQRMSDLRAWMERSRRSFIRALASAKEVGVRPLCIGPGMWNYLSNIGRIVRIPPSTILQLWMGFDFTNGDLVKQSSIANDYTHRVLHIEILNGAASYVIESIPELDAAVVRGKTLYWIQQTDTIPLKQYYYNEHNKLVWVLTLSDIGLMGGRTTPTRWEMRLVNDPDHAIMTVVKAVRYDRLIDDECFMQRSLQKS